MNKELWEKVVNSEVVVNCKSKNACDDFLYFCNRKRVTVGNDARDDAWERYGDTVCFRISHNDMTFADLHCYTERDYEVITYKELIEGSREELKLNNNEKIVKLIDLNERSKEYNTAVVRLKETSELLKKGHSVRLTISSPYVSDVRIPATKDIVSHLIANEEDSLKKANAEIDALLNGEVKELKSKISEFSNSVKEKEQ